MKPLRITVVGVGLLGGSLLQALRDRNTPHRLQGVSSDETIEEALQNQLIDRGWGYDQIDSWKGETDLLVLATPIDRIAALLREIAASPVPFPEGALITDVGSTKEELCTLGFSLFDGTGNTPLFVGGHPMAGSEKRGIAARDGTLFESSLWLLCPPPSSPEGSLVPLIQLIESIGGRTVTLTPAEHDRAVAWVSHLPQALSSSIAATVSRHAPDTIAFAGQGFRDMTRLADSSYSVWKSIFGTNNRRLVEALEGARQTVDEMLDHLRNRNDSPVEAIFEEGARLRCAVPARSKGFSESLIDVVVGVPDRPGALISIVQPLTLAEIDIRDLELLKVREGSGGTFRLAFRSHQDAQRAVEILRREGLKARLPS